MEKDVEKCVMAAVVREGWIPRPPVWLNRPITHWPKVCG